MPNILPDNGAVLWKVSSGDAAYKTTATDLDSGIPSPDFPGGVGESKHVDVANAADVAKYGGPDALRAMGLERFEIKEGNASGEQEAMRRANEILGFD